MFTNLTANRHCAGVGRHSPEGGPLDQGRLGEFNVPGAQQRCDGARGSSEGRLIRGQRYVGHSCGPMLLALNSLPSTVAKLFVL